MVEARRISRRRALALGGPLGVGASLALAGCEPAADPTARQPDPHDPLATATIALLAVAGTCRLTPQLAQGPYWFDVDSIRGDLREDRPGLPLRLALRVEDVSRCPGRPLRDVVIEVWHCDAIGVYSGFGARTPIPAGQPPLGWPNNRGGEMPAGDPTADPMGYPGTTSDGGYSKGDAEAPASGDGTFLRGAQVTDARGLAQFTTVYPGWYSGRTPHVHLKVHLNRATILATQLFFDDAVSDRVYASPPYSEHRGRDTRNATDAMFTPAGLLTLRRHGDAYLAAANLGVNHPILPPGAAGSAI